MAQGPAEEFITRLRSAPIQMSEIARFLDRLTHGERVEAIRAAGRAEQARLYEAAKGFAPVHNAKPLEKSTFATASSNSLSLLTL